MTAITPYTTLFRSHGFVDSADEALASAEEPATEDHRSPSPAASRPAQGRPRRPSGRRDLPGRSAGHRRDRKSTRLNSSHVSISYAVFCLKKEEHITECDL